MRAPGKPDMEKLKETARRARALKHASQLDYPIFHSLLDEAEIAANGNPSLTDILAPYAEPEWVRRLLREEQEAKRVARKKKRPAA